ncbi:hypothetical protein AB2M62_08255 [Sphingomonas sp. MMS12-HWE2-04]|uniref:hypothetical protein n=1 Tax=Sphingomonas sp. MMS12-HWE2-04 TaxID=3234199 RepID=UPI00384B18D0
MKSLPLTAVVAVLALSACNKTPETTDNAMVAETNASEADDAAFDEAPVVENVADTTTPAVTVAAVPRPAANTPAAEAAPLTDAAAIEAEIRAGTGIQRVRYGQGWAWTRDGRILRTADRDGKKVAYFRGGGERPFLVQDADRAYAYQGDTPVRQFDRDGRGRAPDAEQSRAATEAAQESRERRDQASRARDRAGPAPAGSDRDPRPTPSASPTDTPHRGQDRDAHGARDDHSAAKPTPTPGASPDRGRDRHDGPQQR